MTITTMLNGARPLSAEGKNIRFKNFINTAKILVAGNYQPQFVSNSAKDGMDRRFLMLEFKNNVIKRFVDDRRWAKHVFEAEGPEILAWFLAEAHRGWLDVEDEGKMSFMAGTEEIGLEVARSHRIKLNPHTQWVEQDLVAEEGKKMKLSEAWAQFKEWGGRNQIWRGGRPEPYGEFETAMVNLKYKVAAPTDHRKGRAKYIFGLRPKNPTDNEMPWEEV
jgi:phage/plasmid-associated DNA primase